MKKLCTLALAAGLLLGSAAGVQAVDFKAKGSFQFTMEYVDGGNFMGEDRDGKNVYGSQWAAVHQSRDNFEAMQRLHLQLEAVASESLSGVVFFEIGEHRWGQSSSGGALGADGQVVKVKQAYIDWIVPNTDLKLRMGIQGVKLPGFAVDSPIFQDDVAGITASYKFNENVGLTGMWLRLYNDNYTDNYSTDSGFMDNLDLGALVLPLTFDGVKVTPWVMAGGMGENVSRTRNGAGVYSWRSPSTGGQNIDGLQIRDGLFPMVSTSKNLDTAAADSYATLFWGGLTGQVSAADPFVFSWDFAYGSVDNGYEEMSRKGWFGMVLAEYKANWGVPGLYAWYFSGDDDDPTNGSERMPYLATTNNLTNSLSSFGYRGSPLIGGGKGVLGTNPNGTWGVGARIKNVSFIEDVTHLLRVNFMGGTNSPDMADYILGRKTTAGGKDIVIAKQPNATDFNGFGTYLTTADTGLEVNLDTTWKIYENLKMVFELGYIHLWLDEDTWATKAGKAGDSLNYKDAWKVTTNLIYTF